VTRRKLTTQPPCTLQTCTQHPKMLTAYCTLLLWPHHSTNQLNSVANRWLCNTTNICRKLYLVLWQIKSFRHQPMCQYYFSTVRVT